MTTSWIDRALAIATVDGDDVPTDGKFRTWKFIGATLAPDTVGDRLVITITGAAPNLDPVGTLALAPATSSTVTLGDDAPAHNPDWHTWTGETIFRPDSFDLQTLTDTAIGAPAANGVAFYAHGSPPTPAAGTIALKGAVAVVTDAPLIDLAGGYTRLRRAVAASTLPTSGDASGTLGFDTHTNVFTHGATARTLPACASGDIGRTIRVHYTGAGTLTVSRAGADTIDGATSVALDADTPAADFTCQTASTWTAVAFRKTGGGSSTSISDGTASVTCATPDVTTTCASGACTVNAQDVTLTASGTAVLAGDASAVTITLDSAGITAVCASTDAIVHAVGSSEERHTVSGANRVVAIEDAAGTTAKTGTYDNAASSEVYAGTFTMTCVGNGSFTASNDMTIAATAGALYPSCNGNMQCSVGGVVKLGTFGRRAELNDQGNSTYGIHFPYPTAVTPGSAAATTIFTLTVAANSSGRFIGCLGVRNGSANDKQMDVSFDWNADGTTVTSRNLAVNATTVQGTIGTVAGDVAKSDAGLVITVTVANASGFKCTLRGFATFNH